MSKNIVGCAVLVFFALCMNVALSGMVYPQEMMEVSAPYPGATIIQTAQVPENIMVGLESNDNLDQIFAFYKTELAAKDWKIMTEVRQQEGFMLVGQKGSKNVNVARVCDFRENPCGKLQKDSYFTYFEVRRACL